MIAFCDMNELEQLIREHVILNAPNDKGWCTTIHQGCDHGTKGPRAGFIFDEDSISFNCFNCSLSTKINLSQSYGLPPKFRAMLSDFGISDKNLDDIGFNLFRQNSANRSSNGKEKTRTKIKSIKPITLDLPKGFDLLDLNGGEADQKIIDYLSKRLIDPDSYPFMICRKTDDLQLKKWLNRLIIPFFHNDDVIFYQGRDVTGKSNQKYLNASHKKLDRNKILSDYDVLFKDYDQPLYVTEGWFDAHLLGGVALFGNHIKDDQAAWLSRSSREKVYVMDRYGDGQEAALEAVELGWKVAIPYETSFDSRIKDVNDLMQKYGRLYTLKLIHKKTYDDFSAKINIQLHTK